MNYISKDVQFTAVIVIPGSQLSDTVTYSIIQASDGSEFASGDATHISGELWKVTFTPDAEDTFVVILTDSTIDSQREGIYIVTDDVDVPVAPSGDDLTTLARFKTEFDFDTDQHDTLLSRLVTKMSIWAQTYCERLFNAQDYTEYYSGDGSQELLVRNFPINSVASLYDDTNREYGADTLISADDIIIQGDDYCFGKIELDDDWFNVGRKNIKITYNAGYSTVPADIEYAVQCLMMAAFLENTAGINQVVGEEVIYKPGKLRKSATNVLDKYARV